MRIKKYKKLHSTLEDGFDLLDNNMRDCLTPLNGKNWKFHVNKKLRLKNYSHFHNVDFLNFNSKKAPRDCLSSNRILECAFKHIYQLPIFRISKKPCLR
ncbi:hypothetical protein MS2017_2155 [Bathymodiolus thermophilus thioautotrophic gill symbiont]|uniref:Uncharacterized protein n=1 Tax=Bathymodiolus thermophilus thioautotrophic gill symbiont TaxID=2360 RepID=A0A1J5TWW5_9GAMM|nr:hypothetical protein MS2017_2155 [Bathymodiolus thermophilus thioautotrophic gill symbiont]OIR25331.1 hypothetical protein BGC33_06175 [Bathymodiolus thermophilus thioautotrophic gill symbiont]